MWIVASLPFWLLGFLFLYAAPMCIIKRSPDETSAELGGQLIFSLLGAGVFLLIAAKVAS